MADLDRAIAAAREALAYYEGLAECNADYDPCAHEITGKLADLIAALDAAQGQAVAWGMPLSNGQLIDCISPEEHAKYEGAYTVPLYAAPQAPPAAVPARLTPDRERVARALAAHYGWTGWDTARDCRDTPSGDDPEDEREYWRGMADAAIDAARGAK